MAEPPGPARRLSAVFVLDTAAVTGPMLAGWLAAGHRIAAIVVPPLKRQGRRSGSGVLRRRLERRRFVRRYLGGQEVPLLEFGPPYDWSAMAPQLTGLKADVLICFAFPRLIPEFVLGCFPNGGLNIHPALLPHYRGPNPVHCLVIDAAMAQHGGVTLHRMTPRFDEMPPVAGPWNSVGVSTSTFMIGSSSTGSALRKVSRKQSRAQIWKAMSDESTS